MRVTGNRPEAAAAETAPPGAWVAWPVSWSGVWVGALASIAVAVIFGLIGIAIGAHHLGTSGDITKWSNVGKGALVWAVFGSFLSFVAGGWAAAKVAGIRRADGAMLHGAIVWLVALPLMLALLGLGAGNAFGGWYGGLVGAPASVSAAAPANPDAAIIQRNAALAAVTAVLLGLVGAVVGGWLASGESMSVAYHLRPVRPARLP
jgi:hypothetical protein